MIEEPDAVNAGIAGNPESPLTIRMTWRKSESWSVRARSSVSHRTYLARPHLASLKLLPQRPSDPPELFFQVGLGEDQGGRPAVGAMMGVGDEVAAVQQGRDLPAVKGWPALIAALQATMCRSSASKPSRVGGSGLRLQMLGQVADQPLGHDVAEASPGGSAPAPCRRRTARPPGRAGPAPRVCSRTSRRLGGGQVHRLGDQQPLRLDLALRPPGCAALRRGSARAARAGR